MSHLMTLEFLLVRDLGTLKQALRPFEHRVHLFVLPFF